MTLSRNLLSNARESNLADTDRMWGLQKRFRINDEADQHRIFYKPGPPGLLLDKRESAQGCKEWGGVTVRLWTDRDIAKARKVLAGIKPGTKKEVVSNL